MHWNLSQWITIVGGAATNLGTVIYLLRQVLGKLGDIETQIRQITEDIRAANIRIDAVNNRVDQVESRLFLAALVRNEDVRKNGEH